MNSRLARKILEARGWELLGTVCPDRNAIILEAPHTSMMDFVVGYIFYSAMGGKLSVIAKKELFFWPLGPILRALGCHPINRQSPARMVISTIEELKKDHGKPFHLLICPEGTRNATADWKTGYHTLATKAKVPVYLAKIDYGHKKLGIFKKHEILPDAKEDIEAIKAIYRAENIIARHPDQYTTE